MNLLIQTFLISLAGNEGAETKPLSYVFAYLPAAKSPNGWQHYCDFSNAMTSVFL